MSKIQISTVHNGTMEWPYVNSLLSALSGDAASRKILFFSQQQGIYVPALREVLVQTMLRKTQAEWMLCVDSDIQFTLDDVYALYDSAHPLDRPIVAGIAFLNSPGGIAPNAWELAGDDGVMAYLRDWPDGKVRQVGAAGTGFLLIHREVLEKLEREYKTVFAERWQDGEFVGEDIAFCDRVTEQGFPIYVNCSVTVGHIKRVMLDAGWAMVSREFRKGGHELRPVL